jgi:hypothetical protein
MYLKALESRSKPETGWCPFEVQECGSTSGGAENTKFQLSLWRERGGRERGGGGRELFIDNHEEHDCGREKIIDNQQVTEEDR